VVLTFPDPQYWICDQMLGLNKKSLFGAPSDRKCLEVSRGEIRSAFAFLLSLRSLHARGRRKKRKVWRKGAKNKTMLVLRSFVSALSLLKHITPE